MRSANIFPFIKGNVLPYILIISLMMPVFLFPSNALSDTADDSPVKLITPEQDSEIIAKKPLVQVAITEPFLPENLLVLLDGADITGVLDITAEGFQYRPIEVLMSGMHTLSITVYRQNGYGIQKEFAFSTRHTEMFEETYADNELSTIYESVLTKPKDELYTPYSRIESNLRSQVKLKEGPWDFTLSTNLRYLDQSLPVYPPEGKRIDLIDYLLEGIYTGNELQLVAEIGDVQVNESQNTVQGLARRGGKFSFQYKELNLNTFVVQSKQVFGCRNARDCIGIEGTPEDHIMGVSAETGLFQNRASLKTIYVTGGEQGSSFGTYNAAGGNESDALGIVLKTDFFEQKLATEAELDFTEFDPDTEDEFSAESDMAYRLRADGYSGRYTYSAVYEYMGPDYEVVGNPGLPKNREGFTLNGGANFQIHSVNLSFSRYNDNVEDDDLYPRFYTYQGMIDYSFNKFPSLPMGLSYSRSIIDSTKEPDIYAPQRMDTDMISARINYMQDKWNLGFQANHSVQDDREVTGNDTSSTTYTLTSSYLLEHVSISPALSFNRSKYALAGTRTDTYTANLDIRGDALRGGLTYGVAGTFNRTSSSDGFTDINTYNTNFEVAYLLGKKFLEFLNPTAGLRGTYRFTDDNAWKNKNEDFIIILALTTSMPFSF